MQEYSQGVPAFFISHGFILLLVPSLFNVTQKSWMFFGVARAQEIFWGNLCLRYGLWPEIYHRNLNGIRRMFLGVAYGKKSLGEIFFKMLLRKKYFRKITILLNY